MGKKKIRVYCSKKKRLDYDLTIGRLYCYGKAKIYVYITREEDKDKELLTGIRNLIRRQVNPNRKGNYVFSTQQPRKFFVGMNKVFCRQNLIIISIGLNTH